MAKSNSATESEPQDKLFEVRDQLESLTKRFIENLVASQATVATKAKLLNTILQSVGDGLIVFDKDEQVLLANPAATRLAGMNIQQLSRGELLRRYSFFKDDGRTPLPESEEPYEIARGERRPAEIEGFVTGPHLPPEGMWIRAQAAPIIAENGDLLGVVTVFNDITERKRLQTQRDALTTLVTHDLKNHLAGESCFLALLEEEFASTLDAVDLQLLSTLKETSEKFLTICNTLLELHRTDLKAVDSCQVEIDVVQLLESVIQLNAPTVALRGVKLILNTQGSMPKIIGIPSAVHQVFHNLVQNAAAVSPAGETVTIVASGSPSHILVEIKDNGPGIPDEQVAQLFEASKVATKLPTSSFSTGFALYLCRLLVEAHGGKISCQSKMGVGTTFTVELPSEESLAPAATSSSVMDA